MTITAVSRKGLSAQTMVRRKGRPLAHKMVLIAAASAFSTSVHAWPVTRNSGKRHIQSQQPHHRHYGCSVNCKGQKHGLSSPLFLTRTPRIGTDSPWISRYSKPRTPTTSTLLYSSSKNRLQQSNDKRGSELFGFRRGLKSVARKVLPTKWFGTQEEKEALERKQIVQDRVKGELDQMLKGAPLPIKFLAKYVAAPMMGKIASKVAEASLQQQEAMETIMDEARDLLMRDSEITGLLGTPIQIGAPFSQRSSTTVINGRRQMRTEFAVELSGPFQTGVSRIVATTEGVGQLLVESNGRVYNVDLTSKGKMSRPSSFPKRKPGASDDNDIIEAEIIDKKETKQ